MFELRETPHRSEPSHRAHATPRRTASRRPRNTRRVPRSTRVTRTHTKSAASHARRCIDTGGPQRAQPVAPPTTRNLLLRRPEVRVREAPYLYRRDALPSKGDGDAGSLYRSRTPLRAVNYCEKRPTANRPAPTPCGRGGRRRLLGAGHSCVAVWGHISRGGGQFEGTAAAGSKQ